MNTKPFRYSLGYARYVGVCAEDTMVGQVGIVTDRYAESVPGKKRGPFTICEFTWKKTGLSARVPASELTLINVTEYEAGE